MKCENCNISVSESCNFCPNCGARITKAAVLEASATAIQNAPEQASKAASGKVKVGGWIIVFCIFITIIFPISSCSNFSEITRAPATYGIDTESQIYRALEINGLAILLIGIYSLFSGLAIWTGSPNGRRIAVVFLIAYPVSVTVFNFIAIEMLKGTGSGAIGVELLKGIIGSLMFSAIWLAYFKWSKRVKATYDSIT